MKRFIHTPALAGAAFLVATTLAACASPATTGGTTTQATSAATAPTTAASAAEPTAAAEPTTASGAGEASTAAATDAASTPSAASEATSTAATTSKLNLNTVTEDQLLAAIPGFSNRMVREFMEYRPYVSIQQFRQEIGKYVDATQVATYEQYVYVPINVNESDAATIQQIPGVDATTAEALIAARPYASTEAFLSKLGESVSADTVQQAQALLAQ